MWMWREILDPRLPRPLIQWSISGAGHIAVSGFPKFETHNLRLFTSWLKSKGTNQSICGLSCTFVKQLDVGNTSGAGRLLPKHQQDDEKDHGSCYWMVSLDLRDVGKTVGDRSKLLGPKIGTQIPQIDRTTSVIVELRTPTMP